MKVAISTDNDYVSAHFGRCPSFTIVDIEDGKVIKQDPRPERQGTYEVAQSFKLSSDAMITVIEFYIVVATGKPCITGVDLELHGDHKGRPSKLLVNSNARISIGPLKKGGFQSFEFDKPVVLKKGIPYWIVLNKPDKPGEEYAYSVPNSIKDVDEEGIPMPKDWYPDGKASCRLNSLTTGQGKWGYGVGPSQDYYFRIFGATVLHESK